MQNLAQAFPEKTEKERSDIAKKFYRNFSDSFAETIKLFSASEEFVLKRFQGDFSVFKYLYDKGRKCQVHSSHNFNWEFANLAIPARIPYPLLTVYMPISNKVIDRIFRKMRSKTGAILLSATNMRSEILPYRNMLYVIALVADQSPGNPTSGYWTPFLGKPASFVKGPESGARRGNIPIVFSYFIKESRRGYYRVFFELIDEEPSKTKPGELTKKYVEFLERVIREHPDVWLWSHRRWKWDYKEEYGPMI